jgi:predicted nucleic acid-binding protein
VTGFLLDTNIPSEMIRARPEPRVNTWFLSNDEAAFYLSVVTIGELRKGITILPDSKRRSQL